MDPEEKDPEGDIKADVEQGSQEVPEGDHDKKEREMGRG